MARPRRKAPKADAAPNVAPVPAAPTGSPAAPGSCTICVQLRPCEMAYQKYGWEQNDTYLPAAAARLVIVKDYYPDRTRKLQLRQCPECGTYYEYKSDYEFLVNGTEDEEQLTRLTVEEAGKHLTRP